MAATPESIRERASAEATDWLILLQDEPGDPDVLRRFDAWRAESPVNAAAWAATQHISGIIAATPAAHGERWRPFATGRAGGEQKLSRQDRSQPSRHRRLGLHITAVAVAACLALVFMPDVFLRVQADYVTRTAETRALPLTDGSAVVLAPGSAIAVTYSDGERRVRLLAGEAFFEVTPSPNRPFRVSAREIEATVLGTGFDVRMDDDGAAVFVQHGMVRVDNATVLPRVSETLAAGQSVRVTWAGRATRSGEPPDLVGAWRQGQLIAQDQPMHEIVDQLRRYYAGKIVLAGGGLAERRVTGVYNLADPVEALRAIARAHGATARQITPWLLIVSGS